MDKFNDPANGQEQRAMEISDKELETALQDLRTAFMLE